VSTTTSDPSSQVTHRCVAYTSKGSRCRRTPILGAIVCSSHGGRAPQVRRAAAIRHEVSRWTDDMETVDPAQTMLRLLTVTLLRADQHRLELDRLVTEHGWHDAFVGEAMVATADGGTAKVGEYARQIAQWEFRERQYAAELAAKAVAAGLAERQVRVAERLGEQLVAYARALAGALGHDPDDERTITVIDGVLAELEAGR
jgi:hypothetical protein